MIMQYGNLAYFFYPGLILLFSAALYLLLRRRSEQTKKGVLLAVMLANVLQHLCKRHLYPMYWDAPYDLRLSTAYNLCALLILIAPFVLLGRNSLWRDFFVLFGTNAGVMTMAFPHWYIGQSIWQWDVFRYYLCHGLLFSGALLMLLLGLHRLSRRNFWKLPFLFFLSLVLITFNDIVIWAIQGAQGDLWRVLNEYNPCWLFHPPEQFRQILPLIRFFTPNVFLADPVTGRPYIPLLWYCIPMYLLISVVAFSLCTPAERRQNKPLSTEKKQNQTGDNSPA